MIKKATQTGFCQDKIITAKRVSQLKNPGIISKKRKSRRSLAFGKSAALPIFR